MAAKRIVIGDTEVEIPDIGIKAFIYPVLLLIVVWIVFAGPFYIVAPEENGVVRTFGKLSQVTESGLRFKFPWPIQTVDLVNVEEVRRLELGFRTVRTGGASSAAQYKKVPSEALMLTGDENIVSVDLVVQYKVKDAGHFLFRIARPQRAVAHAAEAAIRQVVGSQPIDQTLTTGKAMIEASTKELLQKVLDSYESGIFIAQVKLQDVTPPQQVDAAFKDVQSAKEEKEKKVNIALGYRNEIIPKARGEAAQALQEAEAYKQKRVKEAEGDASRFTQMLNQYRLAKDVTRTRMYLETMEEIFPKMDKYIVDGKDAGGLVNVLSLEKVKGGSK
ncbi:MAG: FtsH protease activity modulator HflK [Candidatus Marinimicrobia bacterium]|nr:FtsH protease activity modulator HflK [Candidatus Neomarinimicrobiota bacterium]